MLKRLAGEVEIKAEKAPVVRLESRADRDIALEENWCWNSIVHVLPVTVTEVVKLAALSISLSLHCSPCHPGRQTACPVLLQV